MAEDDVVNYPYPFAHEMLTLKRDAEYALEHGLTDLNLAHARRIAEEKAAATSPPRPFIREL